LPSVDALYKEYKARGLEVRLIDFRESPDVVRKAVAERGYTAPVLLDESGDTTGRMYGVWGPPTVYLLDRQGRLVGRLRTTANGTGTDRLDPVAGATTPLGTGVYFLRARDSAGQETEVKRLVYLR